MMAHTSVTQVCMCERTHMSHAECAASKTVIFPACSHSIFCVLVFQVVVSAGSAIERGTDRPNLRLTLLYATILSDPETFLL